MACATYIPKRIIVAALGHVGFFIVYALRVNLSVTMVAMVNSTFSHADTSVERECGSIAQNTSQVKSKNGEFNWDQTHQGLALSAFFYGYMVTQIPGGVLAAKYGGKFVFGFSILGTSVFTLLSPIAARTNIYLFVVVRILVGLCEGCSCPAMHTMMSKWACKNEKTRMVTLAYSGMAAGTIIALPVCSFLSESNFLGGWPSAFYVFGLLGIIWFAAWMKYTYDSPEIHPYISTKERRHIMDTMQNCSSDTKNAVIPWYEIFTSIRVWAIIVAHFANNWFWYLLLTGLPSYFWQVLNFNLEQNGFLSALPFIAGLLLDLGSAVVADYLIKNWFTVTQTRRLLGGLAFYLAALCLILASFTGCGQITLSVACMVVGAGFLCIGNSGYRVNHLDISPRFGGVLFGVSNTAGSIAGCIAPLVTGYFTNNHPTRANYRKIFLLAAGIAIAGGTFFNFFVSGEEQEWNDLDKKPRVVDNCVNEGVEVDTEGDITNRGTSSSP